MSLVTHAEFELKKAGFFDKDSDYDGMLGPAVLELVKAHSKQGHSGYSHSITLELFNKVVNYKTLTPITSDADEWVDVAHYGSGKALWQNKRQGSCFSEDGGKTWYDLDVPGSHEEWKKNQAQ